MTIHQPKNILVVAAHPDDEILGCGAMIAKHIAQGDQVTVLILGEGILARKEMIGANLAEGQCQLNKLWDDAREVHRFLGVKELVLHNFPDLKFSTVPHLDMVHVIEAVRDRCRPSIIYTHHHGDANMDHQTVSNTMQAVCRALPDSTIEAVYAFEIASSTEWNFRHDRQFRPNVYFDISGGFLEKKLQALELYRSEIRDFPHPRSRGYLEALATVRGGQAGFMEAEAFELVYQKQK